MTFYTKVTVNGTDVTSYTRSYEVKDSMKSEPTMANVVTTTDVSSAITVTEDMEVIITRGSTTSTDYTIFRGVVTILTKEAGNIVLECADKVVLLQRKTINTTYDKNVDVEVGVISAIAEDLIEEAGLTASVENTGTIHVIEKFICRHDVIFERLKRLAEIVDYIIYYNPTTDTIHFESKGKESYGTTMTVGSQVSNIPDWDYNFDEMANFIKISGAYQELETTELFSGTGALTTFTLTETPASTKVYVGGTLQTGGVVGTSETYDYYVDQVNKYIVFLAGSIPGGGVDNIEVRYSYKKPRLVIVKDSASIDSFGTYELVKNYDDIEDIEDARERGMKLLEKRKSPYVNTVLEVVGAENVTAGMKVTVVDTYSDENREVVIKEIVFNYPSEKDEWSVGDEDISEGEIVVNINERLRRLERESMGESDLVDQTFLLSRSVTYNRRYMKLMKKTIDDTDILIWKHPTQGTWGTNKWGSTDDAFGTETEERVIWPNREYIETFKDDTFEDTTSTTANWDVTNNRLRFA